MAVPADSLDVLAARDRQPGIRPVGGNVRGWPSGGRDRRPAVPAADRWLCRRHSADLAAAQAAPAGPAPSPAGMTSGPPGPRCLAAASRPPAAFPVERRSFAVMASLLAGGREGPHALAARRPAREADHAMRTSRG